MKIEQLTPEDMAPVERCAELFAAYPYKTAQQKAQRLERERLNAFYLAGLRKGVQAGTPHWLACANGGRPLALAGLGGDGWHAGIYGKAMGKVQPWLNTLEPQAGEALLDAVLAAAAERGTEHLSARLDAEDFANIHLFERRGFYLVDVSLKFTLPLPAPLVGMPAGAGGMRIGLASEADHAWIRELGSTTHGGTHFLNDPNLAREGTQRLFSGWLEKCLNGLAYQVYTLKSEAGEGLGFVTYLRAPGFAAAVGRAPLILDFVLISPAIRGGGIGPWFIAETLARGGAAGFDYCELRTSAHNLAAVINYEKLGFRCCAGDCVLHRQS